MSIYCPQNVRVWMPAYMRISRLLLYLLIGPLIFFIFMGLILDGYFEPLPRYIYCFVEKPYYPANHTTVACGHIFNVNACSCSVTVNKTFAESGNNTIRTVLPPGPLSHIRLGFVPGSAVTSSGEDQVPWIGFIAVGFGFFISLALNVHHWWQFISRTVSLDGVKIKYFSMLFSVGPGACLLHLLLVYLTFALVGLCPYMSWATRLLPLLISAIYLGLTQFNILIGLSHVDPFALLAMIPLAAISFFGEIQVAVAMSHLEGGLNQQWQISLTPMWFLGVLMFPACIITILTMLPGLISDGDDFPKLGDIVAYAVFGVIATILVACTLMMACHNDNTWDAATQKGHYSWLSVMVPLMLLVGDYLLLMLVDIVGDCVVHVIRFYRRLENKARMYRNQAIERTNHLAGPSDSSRSVAFAVDNIFNEKEATPHSEFLVHLQSTRASLLENSFTNKSDSAYRSIASVETAKTHEMILIALSSLRNHLERHPKERTDTLKWELLEVCRRREEEGCWSKDNAVVLREILSLFTQLGAVLEQSHTSTIRIVEEPDKPQPPMAR